MTHPPNSNGEGASLVESFLSWLRAGYPQGVPNRVYVSLYAVLHRRLTEFEVCKIAAELAASESPDGQIGRDQIEAAIVDLVLEQPGDDDVARIAAVLEACGWSLAEPRDD